MLTYPTPRRARYTPVKGKLSFRVIVYASRQVYGRIEYQIANEREASCWVTDGQQLQFEEGEP